MTHEERARAYYNDLGEQYPRQTDVSHLAALIEATETAAIERCIGITVAVKMKQLQNGELRAACGSDEVESELRSLIPSADKTGE